MTARAYCIGYALDGDLEEIVVRMIIYKLLRIMA